MKKKIFEVLKTKFEGINEQILNRIADKLVKTVKEEADIDAAVEDITFQQIVDSEADRRATEATQTAVSNYEKKHGLKDGQKITGDESSNQTDPNKSQSKTDTDDGDKITAETIAAAVAAAIKPLSEEIAALKTGKVSGERKQKLNEIIKDLPENLQRPYNRISLTEMSDEDFGKFIDDTTGEVSEIVSEIRAKGSVIMPPIGGSKVTKKPSDAEADAIVNNLLN
jgi:hypothetical protein